MATKEEALQYIKTLAQQQVISRDEIVAAYNEGSGVKTDQVFTKKLGIAEILYYIGGAIVFLGIAILLAQNWSTLNFETKVLATLGAGIAAFSVGALFSGEEKTETIGSAFFLISALVMPIGLAVVFDHIGFDIGSWELQSLISGILFGSYLLSYFVFRKNIFSLFGIIFGTWLFFSFTSFLVGNNPQFADANFFEYRMLVAGLTYILLGHSFSQNERAPLTGVLYGFGILGFLGAAFALGGWEPRQSILWELAFPFLVFGVLFISVNLKSSAFLTFGSLYLMGYILKITTEYFSSGLGWPLALVLAGLSMIAVGYMSLSLKKRFSTR